LENDVSSKLPAASCSLLSRAYSLCSAAADAEFLIIPRGIHLRPFLHRFRLRYHAQKMAFAGRGGVYYSTCRASTSQGGEKIFSNNLDFIILIFRSLL